MTSEIEKISESIREWCELNNAHIYGQNLSFPSYISGLGKATALLNELKPRQQLSFTLFNTTNSELTSVGYGIGRALCNKSSVLVVKQQDFLFLALDQLINTTCNIGDPQDFEGHFKIVCLVSDTGTEGTQAWSNNLSIFESLPQPVKTRYCFSANSFRNALFKSESFIEILFLSTSYTYKEQLFANNLQAIEGAPDAYITDFCNYDKIYILLGFVATSFISNIIRSSSIIVIGSLGRDCSWAWLVNLINSKHECNEVFILEDSSSCLQIGTTLKNTLKDDSGISVPVQYVDVRTINSSGFGLINQLRNSEVA